MYLFEYYQFLYLKNKTHLKKSTLCAFLQCWSSSYKVSVLFTTCGGFHPEGLIVASLHRQE